MLRGCHDFRLSGPGRFAWRSSRRRDARRFARTLGTHRGGHSPTARQGRAGWSSAAGGRSAELPAAGAWPTNGRPPRTAELPPAGSWPVLPSVADSHCSWANGDRAARAARATWSARARSRAGSRSAWRLDRGRFAAATAGRLASGGALRPELHSQHLQLVPLPHFRALFRQLRLRQIPAAFVRLGGAAPQLSLARSVAACPTLPQTWPPA